MSKVKIAVLGIPSVLIVLVIGLTILPIGEFNKFAQQGNRQIQSKQETSNKLTAYLDYQYAQAEWPFLKYNYWFQKKISESKTALEQYKKERPAIIVLLKGDFTQTQLDELINDVVKKNHVIDVKFLSQEEALNIYQERNKNEPLLLETVTLDYLSATIDIYMSDWSNADEIKFYLESKNFVENVVISNISLIE